MILEYAVCLLIPAWCLPVPWLWPPYLFLFLDGSSNPLRRFFGWAWNIRGDFVRIPCQKHQTWWEFQKDKRRSTKEIRDHNQRRSKKLHVILFNHRLLIFGRFFGVAIAINSCDPFVVKSSEHSYSGCWKIRDPHGTLTRNVGILVIETTSPSSPSNGTESQRTPKS